MYCTSPSVCRRLNPESYGPTNSDDENGRLATPGNIDVLRQVDNFPQYFRSNLQPPGCSAAASVRRLKVSLGYCAVLDHAACVCFS